MLKIIRFKAGLLSKTGLIIFNETFNHFQRHWLKIEQLLDRRLLGIEALTLYTFEDANAFDTNLATAIREVYHQAKSEAHLEESLKKVENTWKVQELSLKSHHNTRDMFVIIAIEDLKSVYDDSCISISNIAASRHIGALKPKVVQNHLNVA
jgi:dynein heavy chain